MIQVNYVHQLKANHVDSTSKKTNRLKYYYHLYSITYLKNKKKTHQQKELFDLTPRKKRTFILEALCKIEKPSCMLTL